MYKKQESFTMKHHEVTSIKRDVVIPVRFTKSQRVKLKQFAVKYGDGKVSTYCYQVILSVLESKEA